jgi:hypothetical protein
MKALKKARRLKQVSSIGRKLKAHVGYQVNESVAAERAYGQSDQKRREVDAKCFI